MNKIYILVVVALVLVGGFIFFNQGGQETTKTTVPSPASDAAVTEVIIEKKDINQENNIPISIIAVMQTNKGVIELELFSSDAPKTVENFVKLAKEGFYDGVKFHRVIKGFMLQGGDPLSKDDSMKDRWGTGGPGYAFEDEIHANNRNIAGTIAMANAGPDTNGSQFFINTVDNSFLDAKHTVFGKVVSGGEIVSQIEDVETDSSDRPIENVVIESITISK